MEQEKSNESGDNFGASTLSDQTQNRAAERGEFESEEDYQARIAVTGETGSTGESETGATGAASEEGGGEGSTANGPVDDTDEKAVDAIEKAKYRITGQVDHFDEQNNIRGTYAIGSYQILPVEYGDRMVAEDKAERED